MDEAPQRHDAGFAAGGFDRGALSGPEYRAIEQGCPVYEVFSAGTLDRLVAMRHALER